MTFKSWRLNILEAQHLGVPSCWGAAPSQHVVVGWVALGGLFRQAEIPNVRMWIALNLTPGMARRMSSPTLYLDQCCGVLVLTPKVDNVAKSRVYLSRLS